MMGNIELVKCQPICEPSLFGSGEIVNVPFEYGFDDNDADGVGPDSDSGFVNYIEP